MLRNKIIMLVLSAWIVPACAAPKAALWSFWDAHNNNNAQSVDHSLWQQFLDLYVVEHEDGTHRVAYVQAGDERGRGLLRDYLSTLVVLDPRTLNLQEQLAYWINLYNSLTIDVVLRNPDKTSILRMGKGFLSLGPWDDARLKIAGHALTLNDIEHRIVRPIWQDHRIHYALNCASRSCPNLSKEAFQSHNLEDLLKRGEQAYINHAHGLRFNATGELQLSSIFDWYRDDFASDEVGLIAYLAAHHDTLHVVLNDYRGRIDYQYNWKLNAVNPR